MKLLSPYLSTLLAYLELNTRLLNRMNELPSALGISEQVINQVAIILRIKYQAKCIKISCKECTTQNIPKTTESYTLKKMNVLVYCLSQQSCYIKVQGGNFRARFFKVHLDYPIIIIGGAFLRKF